MLRFVLLLASLIVAAYSHASAEDAQYPKVLAILYVPGNDRTPEWFDRLSFATLDNNTILSNLHEGDGTPSHPQEWHYHLTKLEPAEFDRFWQEIQNLLNENYPNECVTVASRSPCNRFFHRSPKYVGWLGPKGEAREIWIPR